MQLRSSIVITCKNNVRLFYYFFFHDADINECELYDYNRYCGYYYDYYYYHYGSIPKICNNTIGGYECVCPPGYIICDESYECIRKLKHHCTNVYIHFNAALSLTIFKVLVHIFENTLTIKVLLFCNIFVRAALSNSIILQRYKARHVHCVKTDTAAVLPTTSVTVILALQVVYTVKVCCAVIQYHKH